MSTSPAAPPRPRPAPPTPTGPLSGPRRPAAPAAEAPDAVRARRRRAALTAFARTSPGQLVLAGLVLVLACLLAGSVAASAVSARTTALDAELQRTEPVAAAAQDLYAALSEADASAAAAFLSGGIERPEVREQYTGALARAATALAAASAGAGPDSAARARLTDLTTRLPVYAGLVETARANNRQGNPVGAAYLREASALLQSSLLPAAEGIYSDQSAAVAASQDDTDGLPWGAVVLGVLALALLLVALRLLARRTRRVVNPGLAVAAAATAAWLVWLLVAGGLAASRVDTARERGSEQLGLLVGSRILAQQARADETLALVGRGDGPGYEQSFLDRTATLDERLSRAETMTSDVRVRQAAITARQAAREWVAAHARVGAAASSGDYAAAVGIATGDGPQDSGSRFQAVGVALADAIEATGAALRERTAAAGAAYRGLSPAVVVLTVAAVAGIAAGLWPRLREYR